MGAGARAPDRAQAPRDDVREFTGLRQGPTRCEPKIPPWSPSAAGRRDSSSHSPSGRACPRSNGARSHGTSVFAPSAKPLPRAPWLAKWARPARWIEVLHARTMVVRVRTSTVRVPTTSRVPARMMRRARARANPPAAARRTILPASVRGASVFRPRAFRSAGSISPASMPGLPSSASSSPRGFHLPRPPSAEPWRPRPRVPLSTRPTLRPNRGRLLPPEESRV